MKGKIANVEKRSKYAKNAEISVFSAFFIWFNLFKKS